MDPNKDRSLWDHVHLISTVRALFLVAPLSSCRHVVCNGGRRRWSPHCSSTAGLDISLNAKINFSGTHYLLLIYFRYVYGCFRYTLGIRLACFCYTLGMRLMYFRYTVGAPYVYFWYTLGMFLAYFRYTFGILLVCFRDTCGIGLVYIWYTLGILLVYFRYTFGIR